MIEKIFFVILTLGLSVVANAAAYKCDVVGNGDYSVEINTKTELAAFFDNDSWVIVPRVESNIVLGYIVYSGFNAYGDQITVNFDVKEGMAPPQHTLSYVFDGKIQTEELNCSFGKETDLNSGI